MTKKVLLLLVLCLALASCSGTTCLAAQTYKLTESQLALLENNNKQLMSYNSEQLSQLTALKKQVEILQQELGISKAALGAAQQSLSKMQESTKKLEQQVKSSKIGVGGIVTDTGVAPALAFRQNNFELIVFYSAAVQGAASILWF